MLISACMIVKNEEEMLKKTLPNLSQLVDEVVLVDTGSTDKTVEVAEKFGAKVYYFPWINDFSAARDESLKYANGDWILWADADEFIKKEDMEKAKSLIKDSKALGFKIKVAECREDEFNVISYNLRPKLFKNKVGIHFERPINEQPFTQDGKSLNLYALPLNLCIYHWGGFLKPEKFNKKKERNITLLNKAIEKGHVDAAYFFLLGKNYKDMGMNDLALKAFQNAVEVSTDKRFTIQAMAEKAWILYHQKKVKEAYLSASKLLELDPINSSALSIIGSVYIALKKYDEAIKVLSESSNVNLGDDSVVVNLRQRDYVANLILSAAFLRVSKTDEAYEAAHKAFIFDPTDEAREAMEASKCQ